MPTEDFEGFTTGVQPTGWSTAWEGGTWTVEVSNLNKVLQCAPSLASDRALVLDSVDGWANFEAVVRTRQANSDNSSVRGGLAFHTIGTSTRDGYFVALNISVTGSGNGDQLLYVRRDDNATGDFAQPAFASPTQHWAWIKVRRVGTNIKAKAWVDGTPEPATWLIDVTDETYTTGGIGVYCRSGGGSSADPPFFFDNFSIQHYHTASVTLTLKDPASGGSEWVSKTGLAVDVSVDRNGEVFYSATGQSTNGSGELAIAATGCPLAAGTQTVWIRVTDSDGTAGGAGNDSNAFYAPVEVTVA